MSKYLFLLLILASNVSFSQDFSNKGKDFWVGYGYHAIMREGANEQSMVLYFTSDVNANVKVEIPAVGWVRNYTVVANTVRTSGVIPKSGTYDARLMTEGVLNRGIHITSDKPIVAYAHIYNASVSGATLLFPTNTLGQDYYALGFTQISNTGNANAWTYVIATEDDTKVEITPSKTTLSHAANTPFTVQLNKGQVFNLMGKLTGDDGFTYRGVDLTGTRIRSLNCKKIAVFCGSGRLAITCNGTAPSTDNLIQQVFPRTAWGKKYLTAPTAVLNNNYFRVAVSNPATVVKVNGVQISGLIDNFYYQIRDNAPARIEADQPVMVAQYITSSEVTSDPECGNDFSTNGDPEMIYISPVEQTIENVTLNSSAKYDIEESYINVVIKKSAVNSFRLDGVSRASSFVPHPRDADYSYAVLSVNEGWHTLKADSGFNAIAYGYGYAESYGYNAGTNIRDFNQYVAIENPLATVNFPATCVNTSFIFSITLPYKPVALTWDFNNNPLLSPNVKEGPVANPVPDSSFVKDGKTLYIFRLDKFYKFSAPGTYPIKVIVNNPTADGCPGEQVIDYDVVVYAQPVADWTATHAGCTSDVVHFTDATNGNGRPTILWTWNFGDNTVDSVKSPLKYYSKPGIYNVKIKSVTDIGCVTETTKPFKIDALPVATFKAVAPTCATRTITFTSQSQPISGIITYLWWDFGDGTKSTFTSGTSFTHTYATAGVKKVRLVVKNTKGCISDTTDQLITVNALPVPAFKAATPTCAEQPVEITNSSTSSNGAITKWWWSFGDGTTAAYNNGNPFGHVYNAPGIKQIKLVVSSAMGCNSDTIARTVEILELPVGEFTASSPVCIGNTVSVTSASTSAAGPITSWRWDFGDGTTTTYNNANPFTHVYNSPGNKTITLTVKTNQGCFSKTISRTVAVSPLPIADFTTSEPVCERSAVIIRSTSTTGFGSIATWQWDFGDGTIATHNNGSAFTHTYATPGSKTIKLVVTTALGCISKATTHAIMVSALPKAAFNVATPVCTDEQVSITNASTSVNAPISKWWWSFGDGTTAIHTNGNEFTHTYNVPGIKTIKLVAISDLGCASDTMTHTAYITKLPVASFSASTPVCVGNTSAFTPTATSAEGTLTTWHWDFGDGTTATYNNGNPFTHAYNTTGEKLVTLTVDANTGCISKKLSSKVMISPLPVADFTTNSPACAGKEITLVNKSTSAFGRITTWVWNFGDGNGSSILPNGNPIKYVYANAGNYSPNLSVITEHGCKSPVKLMPVSIFYLPVVKVTVPTGNLCLPNNAAFTSLSSIGDGTESQFKYLWHFGDGDTSSLQNPSHVYQIPAGSISQYQVQLAITSSNGCVDSLHPAKVLDKLYVPPTADFDVDSSDVCLGQPMRFSDRSNVYTSPGGVTKWRWQYGDGNMDTTRNVSYTYSKANRYIARLTVQTAEGCIGTVTKTVRVTSWPQIEMPTEVFTRPFVGVLLRPEIKGLNTTHVSYQWQPALFLDHADIQNPVSKPPADQLYRLTVTAGPGCSITDSIRVRLLQELKPPNAFSPNGDNINDTWTIPNLVYFTNCTVEVFDRNGQQVYKSTGYNKPWDGSRSGTPLPGGVYYYIINPRNGYEAFTGSVTMIR